MFGILMWLVFGLIVGSLARFLHPGDDPVGFLPTLSIGVAGSFIGGGINWLLNLGGPFHPAGLVMSVIGGILFCWAYRTYRLDRFIKAQSLKIQQFENNHE